MYVQKLTDRFIGSLKPAGTRLEFRDTQVTGLSLRVTPRGVKTWAFTYASKRDRERRRMTLGRYPQMDLAEARKKAHALKAEVLGGEDPALNQKVRTQVVDFNDLAECWLSEYARPNKAAAAVYDDELMLNKDIRPAIGRIKAGSVNKADVTRVINTMKKRGVTVRCNRALALIRAIYRWGIRKDLVPGDPTMGVDTDIKERPRDRILSDQEISTLWHILESGTLPMSPAVARAMQISLVTAQRIGMVEGMTRAELDLYSTTPSWTMPGSRTKNRETVRVPLSPLAVKLITSAIEMTAPGCPFVFPNPTGDGPITAHAATRALSRARSHISVENFRIHDLRRTAASGMARLGVPPHTISLVLDHISAINSTVTGSVYVKYAYDDEKRAALNRWAEHIEELLSGKTGWKPAGRANKSMA